MQEFVYVLKLQDGKYYAGKSSDPDRRFLEHKYGTASEWTKQYKPIMPAIQEIPITSEHDETNITKDLMKKYGIDNVRGGPWTTVVLSEEEKSFIQKQIHSESDECYGCGESDHFVKECPQRSNTYECYGCGESGHFKRDCPNVIEEQVIFKKKIQNQEDLPNMNPKMKKKILKTRKMLKKMNLKMMKKRKRILNMDLKIMMMKQKNLRMNLKKMKMKL
jgi:predicted GIY-YIG superfamily endonuclease